MSTNVYENVNSITQFLVCPSTELFELNSLEQVKFDEFVYRSLREAGFTRIVIIALSGGGTHTVQYKAVTFDGWSYCCFCHSHIYAAYGEKSFNTYKEAQKRMESALMPMFGNAAAKKKKSAVSEYIGRFEASLDIGKGFNTIAPLVRAALSRESDRERIAVTLPASLFDGANALDQVTKNFFAGRCNTNNLLLITGDSSKKLECAVKAGLLPSSFDLEINKYTTIVREPREDEIRNCLFRLRLENEGCLLDLSPSEIKLLAHDIFLFYFNDRNPPIELRKYASGGGNCLSYLLSQDIKRNSAKNIRRLMEWRIGVQASKIDASETEKAPAMLNRFTGEDDGMQESFEEVFAQLGEMIGLSGVKTKISVIRNVLATYHTRLGPGHYIFSGNPGTGKTTVARMVGKIFKSMGLLKKGTLVEVSAADLKGRYVGETEENTKKALQSAMDGVLFVDEAYTLVDTSPNPSRKYVDVFAEACYTTILKFMEDHQDRICVVFAGYPEDMKIFVNANEGMKRRIKSVIQFDDYSASELLEIFKLKAKSHMPFSVEFEAALKSAVQLMFDKKDRHFENASAMQKLLDLIEESAASRIIEENPLGIKDADMSFKPIDIPKEYFLTPPSYEDVMAEINGLAGLDEVKRQIAKIGNRLSVYGSQESPGCYIFNGNPGTGKTMVARLMGKLLRSLKLLRSDKFIEVRASDLAGNEALMKKAFESAQDGVLFIKEDDDDALHEAIMKGIDTNSRKLCVIFSRHAKTAGSERTIYFDDYNVEELVQIFGIRAKNHRPPFAYGAGFLEEARKAIEIIVKNKDVNFANVRAIDLLLNDIASNAATRIASNDINGDKSLMPEDVFAGQSEADEIGQAFIPLKSELLAIAYAQRPKTKYSTDPNLFFKSCESALLYIEAYRMHGTAMGTGFLINENGLALTCAHVVAGANNIRARLRIVGRPGGDYTFHVCKVLKIDNVVDLALLELDGGNFPFVPLAAPDREAKRNEKIVLLGYPFGDYTISSYTSNEGAITSFQPGNTIMIDIDGKSGNSGGPVISQEDGSVLGVYCGAMTTKIDDNWQELNYMRGISDFWKLFTDLGE
ncbi:MAG: trypsin-like peptidase domain-containing protein [Clostridiales bacterium]|jgi:AAA+ superfamily predicted ATPase|nr:trypsin-like peptidase domain-containing protein [Clostridiales bacterium]